MKKRITSIALSAMLILGLMGCSNAGKTKEMFRGVKWGTTKEEVRKIEKSTFKEYSDDSLLYADTVCGIPATKVLYRFNAEDKLESGGFFFDRNRSDLREYIDDYDNVKKELIKKFGEPSKDEVKWSEGAKQYDLKDSSTAITAVLLGVLTYTTTWEIEGNLIVLSLYGKDYQPSLMCGYSGKIPKSSTDGKSGL